MIQAIDLEQIKRTTNLIAEEYGINAKIVEANFSEYLPTVDINHGAIAFPKRIFFELLLYYFAQNGIYLGNRLININEKINAALSINDVELAEELKEDYFKSLNDFSEQVQSCNSVDYDMRNAILFYLYHELTHVIIAQQPSFFKEKEEELELRIRNANLITKWNMRRCLRSNENLKEEVICDLEACRIIRDTKESLLEMKKTLLDIVHTITTMNCVSNIRNAYVNTKETGLSTYIDLTHSKASINTISRFVFINNYWKDEVMLNPSEVWHDITETSSALSFNQDTIDFCRKEIKKVNNGFFNADIHRSRMIEEEIYTFEDKIAGLIVSHINKNS